MILLDVVDVRKRFGPEPVLAGVTFEVRPGDRIGLVGPNGSGKTTLLRILVGAEEADAGVCRVHPRAHLGYLEQQPRFDPGRTLREEAHSALADLVSLQQEAVEAASAIAETADPVEQKRLAARYDHLQHELQCQDAYNIDHRVEQVLDGLRFRRESFAQPVASLSGGEQNRLMLAKLLLAEPNVMILDEPSNHLDIEATQWLEEFLLESSAAMIVVSHDRYFLDSVTNRTVELFHGTVDCYAGNFSAYWRQKAERLLVERRTYEKQQVEIEKTKDFIRRNAYGQKHAQAEDRRKKLDRIELVAAPREIAVPCVRFPPARRSGDIVVRAQRIAKSYNRALFCDVSLDIERGQRWAVLGPNGCGKTTLLGCLIGLLDPDEGQVTLGQGVALGYFDQQLADLDDAAAVVDAVRPQRKQLNLQQRRNLLAGFGLTGETALKNVGSLSGGERCRAALARLAAADANFLVLDEPTNHLDLWARDALEKALAQFDGTVLLVSHDRYFVNRVADHLLVIEPARVRIVEGNYDAYQTLLGRIQQPAAEALPERASRQTESAVGTRRAAAASPSLAARSRAPAPRTGTKRRFPFRKVVDLEDEIIKRETQVEELQRELAQPDVVRDGDRVRRIKAEIQREQSALKGLYEHWDEATELNW